MVYRPGVPVGLVFVKGQISVRWHSGVTQRAARKIIREAGLTVKSRSFTKIASDGWYCRVVVPDGKELEWALSLVKHKEVLFSDRIPIYQTLGGPKKPGLKPI